VVDLLARLGRPVWRRKREPTVCACVHWPRLKQEAAPKIRRTERSSPEITATCLIT
jgi:hypothetical protein